MIIVKGVLQSNDILKRLHFSDTGSAWPRGPYDSLQMSDIGLRSVYSEIGPSEGRDTRPASRGASSLSRGNLYLNFCVASLMFSCLLFFSSTSKPRVVNRVNQTIAVLTLRIFFFFFISFLYNMLFFFFVSFISFSFIPVEVVVGGGGVILRWERGEV